MKIAWYDKPSDGFCVYWSDETIPIYLHITQKSKILSVDSDNVITLLDKKIIYSPEPVFPSRVPSKRCIPNLPTAEYEFAFRMTKDESGRCLEEKTFCLPPIIEVTKREYEFDMEFSFLILESKYKIPNGDISLFMNGIPKVEFPLKEMKRESDLFYRTGCLIKKGSSRWLKVRYNPDISIFIVTREG